MAAGVEYQVLWVDDMNLDENDKLTDFYYGWQLKAEKYNINLVPFGNWEEAEKELRKDFDKYSAIILDANCKIHKRDIEQEEFITAVLPSLTNIFGEKRRLLPWYLLSAGTMSNFSRIVNAARYQHTKHEDEEWGEMLYIKDFREGESAPEKLFENIARQAKDMAMNVVLYRHQDTFCYMGQDRLIDARARKLMLRMLSAMYYPEENIKYEYKGNPLRQVVEYLFRSAQKQGLVAEECFNGDKVIVQLASLFMAGATVSIDSGGKRMQVRWGKAGDKKDGMGGDSIFPQEIANIVKYTLVFTNGESHTSEEEPWFIDEERKDIFFGYVLQMCHVIKWYGQYVELHNNVEENKRRIAISNEESISK